jgi:pimeloyl-ACP methyl ester carboxylesterase
MIIDVGGEVAYIELITTPSGDDRGLGGAVALKVAATRPDLVASLSCVDGGVYDRRLLFGTSWSQARRVMLPVGRGQITLEVLRAWLTTTELPGSACPSSLPTTPGTQRAARGSGSTRRTRPSSRRACGCGAPRLGPRRPHRDDEPRRWDGLGSWPGRCWGRSLPAGVPAGTTCVDMRNPPTQGSG